MLLKFSFPSPLCAVRASAVVFDYSSGVFWRIERDNVPNAYSVDGQPWVPRVPCCWHYMSPIESRRCSLNAFTVRLFYIACARCMYLTSSMCMYPYDVDRIAGLWLSVPAFNGKCFCGCTHLPPLPLFQPRKKTKLYNLIGTHVSLPSIATSLLPFSHLPSLHRARVRRY